MSERKWVVVPKRRDPNAMKAYNEQVALDAAVAAVVEAAKEWSDTERALMATFEHCNHGDHEAADMLETKLTADEERLHNALAALHAAETGTKS